MGKIRQKPVHKKSENGAERRAKKNELRKQPYRHSQTLGSQDSDTVVLFIW